MEQNGGDYRSTSGQLDGAKTVSGWTTAKPKNVGKSNETSPTEQAALEIQSKYDKKLRMGYFSSIEDIGTFQYVEPMLAKIYADYAHKIDFATEKWGAQVKFNGNRCIITKHGSFTRTGKRFMNNQHIEESLASFFQLQPLAVLDGELANFELRQRLNELNELIRLTVNITPEYRRKSKEIVKFYLYDGYNFESYGAEIPYNTRKHWIDQNIIGKYDYVKEVITYPIKDADSLDKLYEGFVQNGEEGAIIRKLDEGYLNKRTKFLLKLKPEDDDDGDIIAVHEGEGDWRGMAAKATIKWKGKEFNATFKGTAAQKIQILKEQKKWLGKRVEFLYNGLTGLGTPNFARIDIDNCFK